METFKIYSTIDALGGNAIGQGWAHGRFSKVGAEWCEIEYHSERSAQRALNGPQFDGRGAYASNGQITLCRNG